MWKRTITQITRIVTAEVEKESSRWDLATYVVYCLNDTWNNVD